MAVIRVHLAAEDLKRYELTEPPTLDYLVLMQLEAEALQEAIPGFEPDGWLDFLHANGIHVKRAIVWCALRRAGVHVPLAELDFDRRSCFYENVAEPEGKDETSTPDSSPEQSDDSTSPSSPTSSESPPPPS